MSHMHRVLDVFVTLSILASVIVIGSAVGVTRLMGDSSTPPASSSSSTPAASSSSTTPPVSSSSTPRVSSSDLALPGIDFSASSATVLLVVNSKCGYCTDSMPALRSIAARSRESGGRIRTIVVGVEDQRLLGEYIAAHDLTVAAVAKVQSDHPMVQVSPRIFLVDRRGAIKRDWLGRLDAAIATDVMNVATTFADSQLASSAR